MTFDGGVGERALSVQLAEHAEQRSLLPQMDVYDPFTAGREPDVLQPLPPTKVPTRRPRVVAMARGTFLSAVRLRR
jgi:hypothetical protein